MTTTNTVLTDEEREALWEKWLEPQLIDGCDGDTIIKDIEQAVLAKVQTTDEWLSEFDELLHHFFHAKSAGTVKGQVNAYTDLKRHVCSRIALQGAQQAVNANASVSQDAEETSATLATVLHFIPKTEEPELYNDVEKLCVWFSDAARSRVEGEK